MKATIRKPDHLSRSIVVAVLALTLMMLTVPASSYARALTSPGAATWQIRSVDWLRDQGFSPVINAAENWYYSLHPPSNQTPDPRTLPVGPKADRSTLRHRWAGPQTSLPILRHERRLPGESTWYPGRTDLTGQPGLYTGYFRPDPQHKSVLVAVAWMRRQSADFHLVAGTQQPGHQLGGQAAIPRTAVPNLLASFNSGWRMKDIQGGFYLNGRTAQPLVRGKATAAIDDQGHLTVGRWGRDVQMSSHLIGARQNLALIVDQGRMAPGMTANADGSWGSPKNQFQYTDRSALGIDRDGNPIYLVGHNLDLATLARSLVKAGAVRAMELDIHKGMETFASWSGTSRGGPHPTELLPTLQAKADRYLAPDQRDFFFATLRPSQGGLSNGVRH